MELDTVGWVLAVLAAMSVGLSKGGLPVISGLAVPLMAQVMSPVLAAGLLLPVYIASDMVGLWAYRHDFDRRVLVIVLPAAAVGIGIGWATAEIVPETAVAVLVGLIGAVFALNAIFRRPVIAEPRAPQVAPGWFWGTITGFTSFVSHSGGPPWQVYALPLGMSSLRYAGTSTVLFALINLMKLPPYYMLGQVNAQSLGVAVALMVPAAISVLIGVWAVKVIPQQIFFRIVIWALLLISLRLIWTALF